MIIYHRRFFTRTVCDVLFIRREPIGFCSYSSLPLPRPFGSRTLFRLLLGLAVTTASDLGASDVGAAAPELGAAVPDLGAAAPDLGAPDLGVPDLGAAAPDLGTASSLLAPAPAPPPVLPRASPGVFPLLIWAKMWIRHA